MTEKIKGWLTWEENNISNAWIDLIFGNAKNHSIEEKRIYQKIIEAEESILVVKPFQYLPSSTYDPSFDTRYKKGESFIPYYFNKNVELLIFEKEN